MMQTTHLQRSSGYAHVALTNGRVRDLAQAGSARAFVLPQPGLDPEVIFLNTSGGLTSGDRLDVSLDLGAGDAARATTQTAERAYRAEGGPACVTVTLEVGRGARLDWLPQESILFQGASLERTTRIILGAEAAFLTVEMIVLGRAAMGETVTRLSLRDRREVWREGRRVLIDPVRLDGEALARPGLSLHGGARVLASLLWVAPGAAEALPALRDALTHPGVEGATSARDGQVAVRLRAADAWAMRGQVARLVAVLRPGPLPRVWQHVWQAEGAAA